MKIKLEGPLTTKTGYGIASIEYVRGLLKAGHDVQSIPFGMPHGLGDIEHTLDRRIENEDYHICHLIPTNRKFDVLITIAEFNPVPYDWKYGLDNANILITKSQHSKECLSSMTSREIKIVPDGIHQDFGTTPIDKMFDDDVFRFLSVFEWVPRKQGELLIRSFCEEFTPEDKVELWIKSSKGTGNPLVEIPQITKDYPEMRGKIVYVKNHFKDMSILYRMFDGFVLPVALEGFGRTFMEAIACGVKPIGPNAGGSIDFMDRSNSYLVDCDDWEPIVPFGRGLFHHEAKWRVPNKEKLMATMRKASERRERLSASYVKDFKNAWSWDNAIEKLEKILVNAK
jgi:glycosyltransferase involved in cell wall biosynthesis